MSPHPPRLRSPRFGDRLYPASAGPLATTPAMAFRGSSRLVIVPHGGEDACGALLRSGLMALPPDFAECLLLGPAHDPPAGPPALVGDPRRGWRIHGVDLELGRPPEASRADPDLHDAEHSLEVVAAALVRLGFRGRLTPALMPDWRDRGMRSLVLGAVDRWLGGGPERIVVATTDLDHYHEPAIARRAHMALEETLAAGDPDALLRGLEGGAFRPCGAGPLWLAMALGRRRSWRPRVLAYGWSGIVPAGQVGFLAAAFEEE